MKVARNLALASCLMPTTSRRAWQKNRKETLGYLPHLVSESGLFHSGGSGGDGVTYSNFLPWVQRLCGKHFRGFGVLCTTRNRPSADSFFFGSTQHYLARLSLWLGLFRFSCLGTEEYQEALLVIVAFLHVWVATLSF